MMRSGFLDARFLWWRDNDGIWESAESFFGGGAMTGFENPQKAFSVVEQ